MKKTVVLSLMTVSAMALLTVGCAKKDANDASGAIENSAEEAKDDQTDSAKGDLATDENGMKTVDEKTGVYVTLEEFGDNSVNIAVKQFVLVPQRNAYLANAREVIYKALNDAGIEIPFPQRDIHIIND